MQINWRDMCRFADLQKELNYSLEEMENLTSSCLTQKAYTREELLNMFEIDLCDFVENLLTPNTRDAETFKLRQRALHVFQGLKKKLKLRNSSISIRSTFSEAIRVNTFVEVAQQQSTDAIHLMKQLMKQSHESLKMLYECSHSNLDKLVQISDSLNVGARLTGAG